MECEIVDPNQLRLVEGQIETLVTSGKTQLEESVLKDLKKIIRQSEEYVKHGFYILLPFLKKDHSEIRLSCFQLINQFFNRSHVFRELVIANFREIVDLVLETDPAKPLPQPKLAAKQLKLEAIRAIQQWHEKFSDVYKKLKLGYNFLTNCKKIDFAGMQIRSVAEQRRAADENRRKESFERQKIDAALSEMAEMKTEMESCVTSANNCFALLLPEPETFDIQLDSLHNEQESHSSTRTAKTNQVSMDDNSKNAGDTGNCDKTHGVESDSIAISETCSHIAVTNCIARDQAGDPTNHIKCEYCKVKGCSETCSSKSTSLNQLTANTDISSSVSAQANGEKAQKTAKNQNTNSDRQITMHQSDSVETTSDSDEFHEISSNDGSDDDSDITSAQAPSLKVENFDDADLQSTIDVIDAARRVHGMTSQTFSLDISLSSGVIDIEETVDNEALLTSLDDSVQLIQQRYLPAIQRWIQVFTKCGDETQIKLCIDMKKQLEGLLSKLSKLNIKSKSSKKRKKATGEETDSDDDDFEEVASKDGFEADVPEHLKILDTPAAQPSAASSTTHEWRPYDEVTNTVDPTTVDPTSVTVKHMPQVKGNSQARRHDSKLSSATTASTCSSSSDSQSASSRRDKLLKEAPALPYNIDLHYWGEDIEQPLLVSYQEHISWIPKNDGIIVDKSAVSAMTSRMMDFTGKFEPVEHQCRAPLKGGKLCPRRDRFKCPFHGKIVPRDAVGEPMNDEDRKQLEKLEASKQVAAIDDVELQRDIEAATGQTLQRQKRGKGKRAKKPPKYPHLTDITRRRHSSRNRLEGKIFDKRVMKRVAAKLDYMDHKRVKDKFGNQFHYALKNKH